MAKQSTVAKPQSIIRGAGQILAISYPVLAFSTGVRALYQLFLKDGVTNYLGASLSLVAALCYLGATVGFARKAQWAWGVSLAILGFESVMTVIIGILSYTQPETIGGTVWAHFGADYAWFPLVQPILGLLWLLHPVTLRDYGLTQSLKNEGN